jgi:hypothetical protein
MAFARMAATAWWGQSIRRTITQRARPQVADTGSESAKAELRFLYQPRHSALVTEENEVKDLTMLGFSFDVERSLYELIANFID